jgi:hypothetical protein
VGPQSRSSSPKHHAGVREAGAARSATPPALEGEEVGRSTGGGGGLLGGAALDLLSVKKS